MPPLMDHARSFDPFRVYSKLIPVEVSESLVAQVERTFQSEVNAQSTLLLLFVGNLVIRGDRCIGRFEEKFRGVLVWRMTSSRESRWDETISLWWIILYYSSGTESELFFWEFEFHVFSWISFPQFSRALIKYTTSIICSRNHGQSLSSEMASV